LTAIKKLRKIGIFVSQILFFFKRSCFREKVSCSNVTEKFAVIYLRRHFMNSSCGLHPKHHKHQTPPSIDLHEVRHPTLSSQQAIWMGCLRLGKDL